MLNIEIKNLILRKAKPSDLEAIYTNVWSDEEIAKTMLWEPTRSLEDAVSRLERTIKFHSLYDAYFVCLKDTDEPIGFAGVGKISEGYYEERGICIARKYQNRGFGKEVLGALLDFVFDHLNGEKFLYGCFEENTRSKRVALHFGFEYFDSMDITREWDNKTFKVDYYTLLKEDYIKKDLQ